MAKYVADVLSARIVAFTGCFLAFAGYFGGLPALVITVVVTYYLNR